MWATVKRCLYDHWDIFLQAEIRYIWMQKKAIPAYLFFIFRYSTPIIAIINIIGEQAPWWTGSICTNWIWLPVASGVIVSATTGGKIHQNSFPKLKIYNKIIQWYSVSDRTGIHQSVAEGDSSVMRVHAIYARGESLWRQISLRLLEGRSHTSYTASWVLYIAVPVYLAQIAVMIVSDEYYSDMIIWIISFKYAQPAASAAQLPPGFVGCVPAEKSNSGHRAFRLWYHILLVDNNP